MPQYIFAPQAEKDVKDIYDYIADADPEVALKTIDEIEKKCALLSESPQIGAERPQYGRSVRMWPVGDYLIFY